MGDFKTYKLLQKIKWSKAQDIIHRDSSYRSIFIEHPLGEDRLSKLKMALTVVDEYGYLSVNLLVRRFRIGETYALLLIYFMWDQSIIDKEGEEPIELGF